MARLNRDQMEALSILFDTFALKDQRKYYDKTIQRNRNAGSQVNRIRAFFSLLTGLSAALAGLIVQTSFVSGGHCNAGGGLPSDCAFLTAITAFLSIFAVVAPAIGGAFGTLADLYQWDRITSIYENALETLGVADAYSPDPEIDNDSTYRASLNAFAQGTINVMEDEAAQWGQLVRPPEEIEKFIAAEQEKVERTEEMLRRAGGAPQG